MEVVSAARLGANKQKGSNWSPFDRNVRRERLLLLGDLGMVAPSLNQPYRKIAPVSNGFSPRAVSSPTLPGPRRSPVTAAAGVRL